MRYIMRQRILSWGDDFTIKDADGRDVYYVDGKVFSFGDKLSFKDMQRHRACADRAEAAQHRPAVRNHPRRRDRRRGEETSLHAVPRQVHRGCSRPRRSRGHGQLPRPRIRLRAGGREVARVSKKWFSLPTPTRSTSTRGKTTCSILAAAVVIDLVSHPDEQRLTGPPLNESRITAVSLRDISTL